MSSWTHPRLYDFTNKTHRLRTLTILSKPIPKHYLFIAVRPIPSDKGFALASSSSGWQDGHIDCHRSQGEDLNDAIFKSILSGLSHISQYISDPSFTSILFLLPPSFDPARLVRVSKHRFLPSSFSFISHLISFLLPSESRTVEIRRFNPSNPRGPGLQLHEQLLERAQIYFASHPEPPLSNKAKVFAEWKRDYLSTQHDGLAWQSCEVPESSTPPPFIRGVLTTGNRHYLSTAIQVSTGHDFTAELSMKFRPDADDNLICRGSQSMLIEHTPIPDTHPTTCPARMPPFCRCLSQNIRPQSIPGIHISDRSWGTPVWQVPPRYTSPPTPQIPRERSTG